MHQKINISGGAVIDESGKTSSLDNFPAKQAAGCESTPCKTRQRPLTFTERARILERVPFESEKPFFKVLMQPTYVGSRAEYLVSFSIYNLLVLQTASLIFCRGRNMLGLPSSSSFFLFFFFFLFLWLTIYLVIVFYQSLPKNFAVTHIKNQGDVVLTVPNGRSWSAKIRMTPPRFANCVARICKGWYEFANDNNLEVGDVCIFKLLARAEISFEVSIVRFADYAQLESFQD